MDFKSPPHTHKQKKVGGPKVKKNFLNNLVVGFFCWIWSRYLKNCRGEEVFRGTCIFSTKTGKLATVRIFKISLIDSPIDGRGYNCFFKFFLKKTGEIAMTDSFHSYVLFLIGILLIIICIKFNAVFSLGAISTLVIWNIDFERRKYKLLHPPSQNYLTVSKYGIWIYMVHELTLFYTGYLFILPLLHEGGQICPTLYFSIPNGKFSRIFT